MSREDVESVVASVLSGLEESTAEYVVDILFDDLTQDLESLVENVGPFCQDAGLAESDEDVEELCKKLAEALKGATGVEAEAPAPKTSELLDAPVVVADKEAGASVEFMSAREKALLKEEDRYAIGDELNLQAAQERKEKKERRRQNHMPLPATPVTDDESAALAAQLSRLATAEATVVTQIHLASLNLPSPGGVGDLLEDFDLKFYQGRRYGLVGKNGSGKTTLLKAMSSGSLEGWDPHTRVVHVAQEAPGDKRTALETVLGADIRRTMLLKEKHVLEKKKDSSGRLAEVFAELEAIGADTAEARAESILAGLQFDLTMIRTPTKHLSGGWRMRVALAQALFVRPDCLLLDEPTNHLDLEAVIWLEEYLSTCPAIVVVVSHDRAFLDAVCTDIVHLSNGTLTYYHGTFAQFETVRESRRERQRKQFAVQEKKRAKLQAFVDAHQKGTHQTIMQAKSRKKTLARLGSAGGVEGKKFKVSRDGEFEEVEGVEDEVPFTFSFPNPGNIQGHMAISVKSVLFSYGGNTVGKALIGNFSLGVGLDSRIALLGRNGSGKSTALKLIGGSLEPTKGAVSRASHLRTFTFSQHHADQLDLDTTPVEYLRKLFPGSSAQSYRTHLGNYGITGDTGVQRIGTLSGGQKSRVVFAALAFTNPHVLLLDEISNHLDLDTIDALVSALADFKGGIVLVSHDEYLISKVCTELWVVGAGKVTKFDGDFDNYKAVVRRRISMGVSATPR